MNRGLPCFFFSCFAWGFFLCAGCAGHVAMGAKYLPVREFGPSRAICREHDAGSVIRFRPDGQAYVVCIFDDHECDAQALENSTCTGSDGQGELP